MPPIGRYANTIKNCNQRNRHKIQQFVFLPVFYDFLPCKFFCFHMCSFLPAGLIINLIVSSSLPVRKNHFLWLPSFFCCFFMAFSCGGTHFLLFLHHSFPILARSHSFIPFKRTNQCSGFHISYLFRNFLHAHSLHQKFFCLRNPHDMNVVSHTN